jgi:hypothetical protein
VLGDRSRIAGLNRLDVLTDFSVFEVDSTPPATTASAWPLAIRAAACATASRPDAQ